MQKIAARMLIRQFCVHGDDKTVIVRGAVAFRRLPRADPHVPEKMVS